jgi:integrase
MLPDEMPTGALLTRERKGGKVMYEAKWRDSTRTQRKRTLGRAWLEPDGEGDLVKPRGRIRPGFLDEQRAHVAMAKLIAEHEEELERRPTSPEATFDDAVEAWLDYLEHEKRAKPATMRGYRTMVCSPQPSRPRGKPRKARLMRTFGGRKLADITTGDVNRFLSGLDLETISARQVNMHRQVLHSIFAYCMRADTFGLRENPASMTVKRPEPGAKPIDIFEPAEVLAVAEAARLGEHRGQGGYTHSRYSAETMAEWRRINEQDAALIVIAGFTGLRMGELRALRWEDVDLENAKVSVSRAMSWDTESSTKSRQMRTVPLAEQAILAFKGLLRRRNFVGRSDFVFVRPDGGSLDRSAVRHRFVAAQKAAGVRVRRFHDLRHTFGSIAIRKFDLVSVQAMMGHSKITTTQRYLHSKPRPDDAAKLTELFEAVV